MGICSGVRNPSLLSPVLDLGYEEAIGQENVTANSKRNDCTFLKLTINYMVKKIVRDLFVPQ